MRGRSAAIWIAIVSAGCAQDPVGAPDRAAAPADQASAERPQVLVLDPPPPPTPPAIADAKQPAWFDTDPDWSAASGVADPARAVASGGCDGSPVPVLLPAGVDVALDPPGVMVGPVYYAAQLRGADFFVRIHGTRRQFGSAAPARVAPLWSASEGVRSVAFGRFGVAYLLELECVEGPEAPACADDVALRGVLESLEVFEVRP